MAKKLVFGFDFMIYGAPFHKWYRFTYDAVTFNIDRLCKTASVLLFLVIRFNLNLDYSDVPAFSSLLLYEILTSNKNLKDAWSVSFRSELFTSYILTIFKWRNILR